MKNVFLLGMAAQALVTGLLTLTGVMEFRPGQQFFAAGIFILFYLVLNKGKNKKKE